MIPDGIVREDVLAAIRAPKTGTVEHGFALIRLMGQQVSRTSFERGALALPDLGRYSKPGTNSACSESGSGPFSGFAGAFVLSVTPPSSPWQKGPRAARLVRRFRASDKLTRGESAWRSGGETG